MISTFLEFLDDSFPHAKNYRKQNTPLGLCETPEPFNVFPYQERHIQCLWADARLRPEDLHTTDGEQIIVEHPGDWNLEAGPTF